MLRVQVEVRYKDNKGTGLLANNTSHCGVKTNVKVRSLRAEYPYITVLGESFVPPLFIISYKPSLYVYYIII